jgi:hypothetical protein
LLAYKNSSDPEVMAEVLRDALAAWKKLPASERKPGAKVVPPLAPEDLDARYVRTPPERGLVVKVHARVLDRDSRGELCHCQGDATGYAGLAASTDHLWLTESEWKSLLPSDPRPGAQFDMPAAIADRIARFHLVDNTRGEPPFWTEQELRSRRLSLEVERADAAGLRLRIQGNVLLSTDENPAAADRGYEAALLGYIEYDAASDRIAKFELLAIGEHWGEGRYTRGARPGRTPFGVAFDLVAPDHPADRVAPQGMREQAAYLSTGR